MKTAITEGNELIANYAKWELVTNFPPNVYRRGSEVINSISFHKPKLFGKLLEVVDKLEQEKNLYIIIKRRECLIQEMKLTSHVTIIHKDCNTKQQVVWDAVVELLKTFNPTQPD